MANTAQVFISHTKDDSAFVHSLTQALDEQGVRYWSDRSLKPGSRWLDEIESAISGASIFVLVISPRFETSEYALFETGFAVTRARESGAVIVPVLLPGATLPAALRGYQAIRAESANVEAIAAQLRSVVARVEKGDEPVFRQVRLFISSPADSVAERELVIRIVDDVNASLGIRKHVQFQRVTLESFPSTPLSAQDILEDSLRDVDVLVLLLSARIGSIVEGVPTIEAELRLAQDKWTRTGRPQIFCYLKTAPVKLDSVAQVDQFRRVLEFRDRLRSERLVYEFESASDLERAVRTHLANVIESTGRLASS